MKKSLIIIIVILSLSTILSLFLLYKNQNKNESDLFSLKQKVKYSEETIDSISKLNQSLNQDNERLEQENKVLSATGWNPVDVDLCWKEEECLFRQNIDLIGLANIEGYYIKRQAIDYLDNDKKVECDSFVITKASNSLKEHFKDYKNEAGQLIINLYLGNLEETEKIKILGSNFKKAVRLRIFSKLEVEHETPVCYSPIDVLAVEYIK